MRKKTLRALMKAGDLMANYECGEGSISLTPEFNYENSLLKLDVLSDWIYDLQEEYDKARLKLNKKGDVKWMIYSMTRHLTSCPGLLIRKPLRMQPRQHPLGRCESLCWI